MLQLSLPTWFVTLCTLLFASSTANASPFQSEFQINFRTTNGYMVVVPVSINGVGPFNFLLDTGTSRTMVDARVADQLGLQKVDARVIVGLQGQATISLVHCSSLSMGGATVLKLDLTVMPKEAGLPPSLNGILGEDFLENFDVLIDNRHHQIELESDPHKLEDSLAGERLPLRLDGIMDGEPTIGRLIVECRSPELSRNEITLLLDSGTNSLVWFKGPQSLGDGAVQQDSFIASSSTSSNPVTVSTRTLSQLRFGRKVLSDVTAIAPPARLGAD